MSISDILIELDRLELNCYDFPYTNDSNDTIHQIIDHYKEGYEIVKLREAYQQSKTKATKALLHETKDRYERYLYYINDWSELPHIQSKIITFLNMDHSAEKATRLQRLTLMRIIDSAFLIFLKHKNAIHTF
jgi:hypothetical protein